MPNSIRNQNIANGKPVNFEAIFLINKNNPTKTTVRGKNPQGNIAFQLLKALPPSLKNVKTKGKLYQNAVKPIDITQTSKNFLTVLINSTDSLVISERKNASISKIAAHRTIALVKATSAKNAQAPTKFQSLFFSKNLDRKKPNNGRKTRARICGPSPQRTKIVKRLGSSIPLKVSAFTSAKIRLM